MKDRVGRNQIRALSVPHRLPTLSFIFLSSKSLFFPPNKAQIGVHLTLKCYFRTKNAAQKRRQNPGPPSPRCAPPVPDFFSKQSSDPASSDPAGIRISN